MVVPTYSVKIAAFYQTLYRNLKSCWISSTPNIDRRNQPFLLELVLPRLSHLSFLLFRLFVFVTLFDSVGGVSFHTVQRWNKTLEILMDVNQARKTSTSKRLARSKLKVLFCLFASKLSTCRLLVRMYSCFIFSTFVP